MKELIQALLHHLRLHGSARLLVPMFILLAALFAVNYSYDLEDSRIDAIQSGWLRWAAMFAFHAVPYLLACLLLHFAGLIKDWFRKPAFWYLFIFGFGFLALDRSMDIKALLLPLLQPTPGGSVGPEAYFKFKLISNLSGLLSIILPLLLVVHFSSLKLSTAQSNGAWSTLGLGFSGFKARPYFILLGAAAIVVWIGSQFTDIQDFYPKYNRSGGGQFAASGAAPDWLVVLLYELTYGFDFISTEIFFRGFLVLAMYRFLGPHVLLPMAVCYAILHFGKPLTEAISSIFGGYLLGVLAIHHKNIWGGVVIHVGMAWMMEVAGFIHKFQALP